ncbi:MAG: cytochrome C [Acidobacteria bacterium]|nr:cytochrome C [Acidobacteriota bacterium]
MKASFSTAIGTAAVFTTLVAIGVIVAPQRGRADSDDSESSRIRIGFAIAPVPLNLHGKNRSLVGLGSYIVNAQGDCNGCHSAGPASEFVFGGIPYFGQRPTKINPATYLGGGSDFGTLDPGGLSAHIITRNLTPDKTGRPEGGATFDEFVDIIRHGTDRDHWHPTCTGALGPHCVPPPFDGSLLQIMPWPIYANMNDHDLRAIYEYLSAIPCLEGDPGNPAGADTHGTRCK